jgi:dienelactone hydrolase
MTRQFLLISLTAIVLLLAVPFSASAEPTVVLEGTVVTRVEDISAGEAGPHAVEVADGLLIRDQARNKSIGVEVCYPKTAKLFPVIIFSHGAIASARDYRLLAAYWASYGYVCVLPTHDDAVSLHMTPGNKISVLKLARLAKVSKTSIEQRQQDVAKTIDALALLPEKVPGLRDKLDLKNIALAGHHAGAFAAQATAGASIGKANKQRAFDERIKAVVAITGKDWQQPDIARDDLAQVKMPLMIISFSIDGSSLAGSRQRFFKAMENAPAGNKFFVTADVVGKIEKPSLATIRKAVKNSNVELISFHPFRKLRKSFQKDEQTSTPGEQTENVKVGEIEENERVGASVLQSLGLGSLLPERANRGGFTFLMSFTIPFLDGYLKDDKAALERLVAEDGRTFGDMIVAKIERY